MRWIWIDKFTDFESGKRAVAIKNVTLAEDHIHDLYRVLPLFPHSLIVEGLAQTGGMLVGEAHQFAYKVVLAKLVRATFHKIVRPGETLVYDTKIDQVNETGATIHGTAKRGDELIAEVEIMFSHIENNMAGMKFPEHNFVFTKSFTDLLDHYRHGRDVAI